MMLSFGETFYRFYEGMDSKILRFALNDTCHYEKAS